MPTTEKLKKLYTVTGPWQQGREMLLPGSLYLENNVEAKAQLRIVPVEVVG